MFTEWNQISDQFQITRKSVAGCSTEVFGQVGAERGRLHRGGQGGRGVFGRNESVNERNLAVSAFDRQAL